MGARGLLASFLHQYGRQIPILRDFRICLGLVQTSKGSGREGQCGTLRSAGYRPRSMDLGDDSPVPFVGGGIGRSGRSGPSEGRMCLLRWG